MANANISHVTLINTFSDWRGATNDLANSANDLRNGNYLREAGAILNIKNGALYVDRQTGVTFNVTANANVENNLLLMINYLILCKIDKKEMQNMFQLKNKKFTTKTHMVSNYSIFYKTVYYFL